MSKAQAREETHVCPTVELPDFVLLPLKLAGVDDPTHLRFYTEREVRSWSWVVIGFEHIVTFMEEEGISFREPGHSVFAKFGPLTLAKLKKAAVTHEVHFFEMDPAELEAIIGDAEELEFVRQVLAEEDIQLCAAPQPKRSRGVRGGKRARGSRERKEKKRVLQ